VCVGGSVAHIKAKGHISNGHGGVLSLLSSAKIQVQSIFVGLEASERGDVGMWEVEVVCAPCRVCVGGVCSPFQAVLHHSDLNNILCPNPTLPPQ
jgi:hypothetical protein